MKKILISLSLAGLSFVGFATVWAQYYDYGSYSSDSYYMDTSYSNYSSTYTYPQTYSPYNADSYRYRSKSGVGSYTIGCITYYYNARTGAQLYTENICTTNCAYQYPSTCQLTYSYTYPVTYTYPTSYSYPVNYSYPSNYYNSYPYYGNYYGNTQYCTYSYVNGGWYPNCGY